MESIVGAEAEADLEQIFLRHLLSFPCLVAALFGLSEVTRSTSLPRQRTCNQAPLECLQQAAGAIVALLDLDDRWET